MPELKNSFTGGKMNKDLDERILPSADYRDALNIGVATSEDSDVGAAQNILGNTRVSCAIQGPGDIYHEMSKHIVAVADNQNDKIYRFVNTERTSFPGVWMDRIVEFDVNKPLNASCEEKEKAVMVDIYKVQTTVNNVQSECDNGPVTISVSGNVFQLRWGMLIQGTNGVTILGVTITSTSTANLLLSADNDGNNPTITTGNITLEADRVLNFSSDRFITGVNILDGMIFWTDNYSEPKKVNIERGLVGSLMTHELSNYQYKSFDQHTKLVVNDINPTECTKISPNGCGEDNQKYGCTDASAGNYDPDANSDDGSCTYGADSGDPGCISTHDAGYIPGTQVGSVITTSQQYIPGVSMTQLDYNPLHGGLSAGMIDMYIRTDATRYAMDQRDVYYWQDDAAVAAAGIHTWTSYNPQTQQYIGPIPAVSSWEWPAYGMFWQIAKSNPSQNAGYVPNSAVVTAINNLTASPTVIKGFHGYCGGAQGQCPMVRFTVRKDLIDFLNTIPLVNASQHTQGANLEGATFYADATYKVSWHFNGYCGTQ